MKIFQEVYDREQQMKEPPLKMKYSNATRRKQVSNQTRISIAEYRTIKPENWPELVSITKYPYNKAAHH